MAIMYRSTRNLTLFYILISTVFSCKEPCLDLELINENTIVLESWFTDSEILNKSVTSSIGISDDVLLTHEFHDFGDSIWDDCGNASQSFRNSVTYQFFNFPFVIVTEQNKQGEEDGFEFRVIYNTNYKAIYKLTSQSNSTNNSIELLYNFELNNQNYSEIFKISFNQTQENNEIKELFYVKEFGIVFIELNGGTTLTLG